jgi:hypothetical protein
VIATGSQPKGKTKKKKNLATKTQPTRTHTNWEPNPFVRPSICLFVCLINPSIDGLFVCLFVVIFYEQIFIGRVGGWVDGWAKGFTYTYKLVVLDKLVVKFGFCFEVIYNKLY